MSPSMRRIFLLLIIHLSVTSSWNVDGTIKTLDRLMIEARSMRNVRDSEDASPIWLEYEFNSGVGNREELIVRDISVHEYDGLPNTTSNWQFLEVNGTSYLARAEKSSLSLYNLDLDNDRIESTVDLNIDGDILVYKVIGLSSVNLVAVLCVKSNGGTLLKWYRLENGNTFRFFWSWPVQKHVLDLEFVQQEDGNQLLLLVDDETGFTQQYSTIDVYGCSVDFSTNDYRFWLFQRTLVHKTFDIQVCSIYESISLAFQGTNNVFLYRYTDFDARSIVHHMQTIQSQDSKNFVCFESGYLQFLAISGPEAGLYLFVDDEFQYNTESETNFDVSEVSWIKDVRLNTYRDESLLLLQLKNNTVIALGWQGPSFKRIQLPSNVLDRFDLSTITPIPKYGFFVGNRLVKFRTEMKELKHPIQSTTEKLLVVQHLLNETLNHQESILNETETRLDKSYLKNPVITGFWNLSAVNASDAIISNDVTYHSVTIGSRNLTKEDLDFDVNVYAEKLKDLEGKIKEIESNLMKARGSDLTEFHLDSDVEVFGNINITGSLSVKNLNVEFINGVDVTEDFVRDTVEDKKIVNSIDAGNAIIYSLNGIPVEEIRFSDSIRNYHNVNFSKINKAQIKEHLSFTMINGIHWETLLKNVVWIDQSTYIPGNTVIEGTLAADIFELDLLNDLRYPEDYVLTNSNIPVNVISVKSFDKLKLPRLQEVKTLNGIDFEDYIILNKHNVLDKEITFKDLEIEGEIRIDGEISGLEEKETKLLNETSKASTDVTFSLLNVSGNVTIDTLFVNKRRINFEDLLLRTEENVAITGQKTFLGDVRIKSNMTITSGMVNGHFLDEFATLDTEQEFPNLAKILPNVTFGNVAFGAAQELESFLRDNSNPNNCLEKIIVFKSPIIVDELSFDKLNNEISFEDFYDKLNETFRDVRFVNVTTDNLFADNITATTVNGLDYLNLIKTLESSNTVQEFEVDRIETDHLNVSFINGMPFDEIVRLQDTINATLTNIFNGNISLESLQVTGIIKAESVNGESIENLFNDDETRNVVFENGVAIKNLTILGLINGFNFSELISDTVLKTDTNIVVEGRKTFDVVNCGHLKTVSLNGHPVENIIDPSKEQVLTGPVIINGSITVSNDFNSTGKVNNITFHDLVDRFKPLSNNTFELYGNVQFNEHVVIENLYTNGSIQGRNFDSFLKDAVFKDENNVTITGTKVFENSVTFNRSLIVRDKLNDVDLKKFKEKAVFIDQPFSIKSDIVFKDGIRVKNSVTVKTKFEAKSIMGVDIEELRMNVLHLNRPNYITEPITLTDVNFLSDIDVEKFNDINTRLLIPLHTEQIIPVEVLKCTNVEVENIRILGKINGHYLNEIQENTFMLSGKQNITGHLNFRGHVHMRRDFNARLLNGIDPTKIIPLDSASKIHGNFIFTNPIYLNQSLRVLGYLNNIDPVQWKSAAVTTNDPLPQTISGSWTVHGNVYLEKGASGSEILNGTNVTELSNALARKHFELDAFLEVENANLGGMCEDLKRLKNYAEKQIYQFDAFDYLQIIEFDSKIVSVHYFELGGLDYLILSYETCHMHAYLFSGSKFELVENIPDFGVIDRWNTFKYDETTLYFLTLGKNSCGKGPVNLWKLENQQFTHVIDLGRNVDSRKISHNTFLTLINRNDRMRSSKESYKYLNESLSSVTDDNVKLVLKDDQMLLTSKNIYEYNVDRSNNDTFEWNARRPEILNFKAGALEKEMNLYYDEDLSKDHVFICSDDPQEKKILQTIKAHRPSSFSIVNFEGSIETLLVFVENKKNLQIYEYKGIVGFAHRDTIRINVDKLLAFKIRKYKNVARRQCLALIHENRLTILEAEMQGEKLDMEDLSCSKL